MSNHNVAVNVGEKTGKTDMEENLCQPSTPIKDCLVLEKNPSELEGHVLLDSKTKEYGLLPDAKQTETFLLTSPDFINESTAMALLRWSVSLRDDPATFDVVSRQCLYILYLLDLSRQVGVEPVYCISPFFARISEQEFNEMFEKEIVPFREKLQSSSWDEVIDDVLQYDSTDDDDSSLSIPSSSDSTPSLDPLEVYVNLPPQLKKCIDDEDIGSLEEELNKLPLEEAETYVAQFLQAKLFVPIDKDENELSDSNSNVDENSENAEKEINNLELDDD